MADVQGQQDLVTRETAPAGAGIRARRGLRIALLSLATAILLTGAAAAGVYAYRALNHGAAAAQFPRSR